MILTSVPPSRTRQGSFRRQSLLQTLQDVDLNESLTALTAAPLLEEALKGGGQGAAEVETGAPPQPGAGGAFFSNASMSGAPGSPPPFVMPNTMPLYTPGGEAALLFRAESDSNDKTSGVIVKVVACCIIQP